MNDATPYSPARRSLSIARAPARSACRHRMTQWEHTGARGAADRPELRSGQITAVPAAGAVGRRAGLQGQGHLARTSAVYCHPVDVLEWPAEPDLVERVALRVCSRRSWSTPTSATRARSPGSRSAPCVAARRAGTTVVHSGRVVASVERKSLSDLVSSLTGGRHLFAVAELSTLSRAAVVVEDRYSQVFTLKRVRPSRGGRRPGRAADPVAERADRVLREPQAGREVDLPVPRRRGRVGRRRASRADPHRRGRCRDTRRRDTQAAPLLHPRLGTSATGPADPAWPSRTEAAFCRRSSGPGSRPTPVTPTTMAQTARPAAQDAAGRRRRRSGASWVNADVVGPVVVDVGSLAECGHLDAGDLDPLGAAHDEGDTRASGADGNESAVASVD